MTKLVLLRHGQSLWNKENRFTGWKDVDLSDQGRGEAQEAGRLLKAEGFVFDQAFTSVLKRAIRTLWLTLDQMDQMWVPVTRTHQLNERHYGNLEGLNKKETTEKFGEDQVFIWRRSYDTPPPALELNDPRHPKNDRRYKNVPANELPATESLKTTVDRVVPYWENNIAPLVKSEKTVLIAAHGNSLRALVKHLENISDEAIADVNIPTGTPLVYELDSQLSVISKKYLGDAEKIAAEMKAVANQAKG